VKKVEAIVGSARTRRIADATIFVMPLGDAIRIRTGEHEKVAV